MTTYSPRISIHVSPKAPTTGTIVTLRGDEELAEWNFQSRTNHPTWTQSFNCTPSVVRWYPQPREGSGDYRTDITPLTKAIISLNGEQSMDDKKTRYLFGAESAIFNRKGAETGYPDQAYITMQGNKLKGAMEGDWFVFETLKPTSNVAGMTHLSHPHFVHKFDLVCWNKNDDGTWYTRHHPNTPQGIVTYFLVSDEGVGWIPSRYIKV